MFTTKTKLEYVTKRKLHFLVWNCEDDFRSHIVDCQCTYLLESKRGKEIQPPLVPKSSLHWNSGAWTQHRVNTESGGNNNRLAPTHERNLWVWQSHGVLHREFSVRITHVCGKSRMTEAVKNTYCFLPLDKIYLSDAIYIESDKTLLSAIFSTVQRKVANMLPFIYPILSSTLGPTGSNCIFLCDL